MGGGGQTCTFVLDRGYTSPMVSFLTASLVGCSMNDISSVEISQNSVNPVALDVSWESQDPGPSWVAFGLTDEYTHLTPVVDDGEDRHAATLVGMPPDSDVNLRVFTELADGTIASSWNRVFTNGSVPPMVPQGTVNVHRPDQVRDGVFLVSLVGDRGSLQVIDREGNLLWYLVVEKDHSSPGFVAEPEGGAFSFNVLNEDHSIDDGRIMTVGLDGLVQREVALSGIHHTFGQKDDGTIANFSTEIRTTDEYGAVAGDRLLELGKGQNTEVLFNSWDHFEVIPGDEWDSSFFPGAWDWTHMNGATWHPDRQSWLISLNGLEDIIEVDGESGSLLDVHSLDGVQYTPHSAAITDPHGPDWTLDGDLLVFGGDSKESWCSAYDVREPRALTETWTHGRGEGIFGMALGEARQLTDGNILCNFGTGGIVRELTPDGEIVWEYQVPMNMSLGQTRWLPDAYSGRWVDGERR